MWAYRKHSNMEREAEAEEDEEEEEEEKLHHSGLCEHTNRDPSKNSEKESMEYQGMQELREYGQIREYETFKNFREYPLYGEEFEMEGIGAV